MHALYLAWQYLVFNRLRSLTLIACVTLIAALPLSLEVLLAESERQLLSRAESTPLLLGARGSALDLVMNALYFDDEVPELVSMRAVVALWDSGLADPVPLYSRFQARGFPIVGTTLDYFDFRGLELVAGRQIALLGEAVLGASVAEELGLGPGDTLLSSSQTVFDLAGVYPLKMNIVGVLERTHKPDDLAVFVDIRTAWVIEGIGHGHQDLSRETDGTLIMQRSESGVVASPKLFQYNEITPDNVDSFHFHGDAGQYPVAAVIAIPHDVRSSTILRGRYLERESANQIIVPAKVIDGLLQNIFRIKNVLDAVIVIVGAATLLAHAAGAAAGVRAVAAPAPARAANHFQARLQPRDYCLPARRRNPDYWTRRRGPVPGGGSDRRYAKRRNRARAVH
jgi:putative ABC transport system permease protein